MSFQKKVSVLLVLFFLICSPVGAQTEPVRKLESVGRIDFSGLSRSVASQKALDEAVKNAVRDVAVQMLGSTPPAANADKVIEEKLVSRAHEFVRNYQVLDEKVEAPFLIVRIQAEVWLRPIQNHLKTAGLLTADPKAEANSKVINLRVVQPARYKFVVAFRKALKEQIAHVDRVDTVLLEKPGVTLRVQLDASGSVEQFKKDLQSTQIDGRPLKLSQAEDDLLDVRF